MSDIGDAVCSQDVEREAAGSCDDAGVVANSAPILVARHVPDIMVSVLDGPMATDGGGPRGSGETGGGRYVIGNFTTLAPHAGGGGSKQGVSRDTNNGLDERMPLGGGQGLRDGKHFDGAVLLTGSAVVPRKRDVGGGIVGGDGACSFKQIGLVGLQLDQQMVPGIARAPKCFFDSAWRPR